LLSFFFGCVSYLLPFLPISVGIRMLNQLKQKVLTMLEIRAEAIKETLDVDYNPLYIPEGSHKGQGSFHDVEAINHMV